jgi:hypothetical protein
MSKIAAGAILVEEAHLRCLSEVGERFEVNAARAARTAPQ